MCLAIFMGSMVSGGLQVLEDRMYGYHEGYLVTPISTGTLVAGQHPRRGRRRVDRGRPRAALRRAPDSAAADRRNGETRPRPRWTVFLTSLSIASLWFLLFARARSASLLRGMFGIINVLLFFPSGALYPGRVVSEVAREAVGRGPAHLRRARAAQSSCCAASAPPSVYADWVFLATFTLVCGGPDEGAV